MRRANQCGSSGRSPLLPMVCSTARGLIPTVPESDSTRHHEQKAGSVSADAGLPAPGVRNRFRRHPGGRQARGAEAELTLVSRRIADPSTPGNGPIRIHAAIRRYDPRSVTHAAVVAAASNEPVVSRSHAY
jgi:hypothetical protein